MGKMRIEIDSDTIKRLVLAEIERRAGERQVQEEKVIIQVKSKQNYRVQEWETGDFRAIYEADF